MSISLNTQLSANAVQTNPNLKPKISKENEALRNQISEIGKTDPEKASLLSRKIVFFNGTQKSLDSLKKENLLVDHFHVPRLKGGMMTQNQIVNSQLPQPGHGVAYIILRRGENIKDVELTLTDKIQNTIKFKINNQETNLIFQENSWSSIGRFLEEDPKFIMSHLHIDNNCLCSDQKYWVSVNANKNLVSCGFGEICDVTKLFEVNIDQSKLKNIQAVEFRGEDPLGNTLPMQSNRVVMGSLKKGGPIIVPNSQLEIQENHIKELNLPSPVQDLIKEMEETQQNIEKLYGNVIWDKIQNSLDGGLLRQLVEQKKQTIASGQSPLNSNQVYVRIGFGENYKMGPGNRMVIELWPSKHESPIHQHSSSYSYIKILKGEVVNKNYPILSECSIGQTVIAEQVFKEGDRTWLSPDQNQIHKIENKTSEGVISFHGYKYGDQGSQPLDGVFDLIDKDGNYLKGGKVVSHWDDFAKQQGYNPGIIGFLEALTNNYSQPINQYQGLIALGVCKKISCENKQKQEKKIGTGDFDLSSLSKQVFCSSCSSVLDIQQLKIIRADYKFEKWVQGNIQPRQGHISEEETIHLGDYQGFTISLQSI